MRCEVISSSSHERPRATGRPTRNGVPCTFTAWRSTSAVLGVSPPMLPIARVPCWNVYTRTPPEGDVPTRYLVLWWGSVHRAAKESVYKYQVVLLGKTRSRHASDRHDCVDAFIRDAKLINPKLRNTCATTESMRNARVHNKGNTKGRLTGPPASTSALPAFAPGTPGGAASCSRSAAQTSTQTRRC